MNPRVVVDFVANTKDLASGLGKASAATDKAEGKFGGMGKAAVAAGGAAGLAALAYGLHRGIDELTEASKVSAQTAAVIKSTGGAAGVSAKHVSDLAESLMKKTGVDDEAIASGQNLLLTFTRIKSTGGIFDAATKSALDMSVAMGTDMKSASILVGKALNDPIKGLGRLTKVGATFSPAQEKLVKSLVATGDTAGAQAVILKELQKEFGGSAEAAGKTLPGQLSILNEEFSNLTGQMVSVLVPILQTVTALFTKYPGLMKAVVFGVAALAVAMVGLNAVMLVSSVIAAPLTGTILLVAAAIAVLVVAIILAIKYWDQIQGAMEAVFEWAKSHWPLLLTIIAGPIGLAVALVIRHWGALVSATTAAWDGLVAFLRGIGARVAGAFATVQDWLTRPVEWAQSAAAGVRSAFDSLMGYLAGIGARIASAFATVREWLGRPGQWADNAAADVRHAFDSLIGYLGGLAGRIAGPINAAANAIKGPLNAVISAWNRLVIPGFHKTIDMPGPIPSVSFGWGAIGLPDITPLATGGVISRPTLAMIGEGGGREVVTPEALLREIVGEHAPEVRVFIGDEELRSMVRYEVRRQNQVTAAAIRGGTF